ncbi:MAG TPA: FkbM family methyltransferase [Gemmatimonadaceae bacterium]|jgi:FkbM family methyltransferase
MSLASVVRRAIPRRWQVPARYYHQRMMHLLEPEFDMVVWSVYPDSEVVDAGANVGVFTYAFLRQGATVHAFEPQPGCVDLLEAYAANQSLLQVHPWALGASRGRARLFVPSHVRQSGSPEATLRSVDAAEIVDVDIAPLDQLGLSHVSLIKIDVEGAEAGVLAGAAETIERCRPLMMIEIEQRHHSEPIASVFEDIVRRGYHAECLVDGVLAPVSGDSDSLAQLNARGVHNFLFRPTDESRQWTS